MVTIITPDPLAGDLDEFDTLSSHWLFRLPAAIFIDLCIVTGVHLHLIHAEQSLVYDIMLTY